MKENLTHFFKRYPLLFEKESPKSYSKGGREAFLCRLEVYWTEIISILD